MREPGSCARLVFEAGLQRFGISPSQLRVMLRAAVERGGARGGQGRHGRRCHLGVSGGAGVGGRPAASRAARYARTRVPRAQASRSLSESCRNRTAIDDARSAVCSNIVALLDGLDYVRGLGIDAERAGRINPTRLRQSLDEDAIMMVQHIADLEPARRTVILVGTDQPAQDVKRTMFGRANLALPRHRILAAA